jgi:hypothetical protein
VWQLIAQQTETGSDPVEWVQYGAIGLVVVLILLGWLWPRPAVERLIKDNDRLRAERDVARQSRDDEMLVELRRMRSALEGRRDRGA